MRLWVQIVCRLLPDGPAESTRCMGLCHAARVAQQRLHANCLQTLEKPAT